MSKQFDSALKQVPNHIKKKVNTQMKRLTNIKFIGRYKNMQNGKEDNVYRGYNSNRGTEHLFYLRNLSRIYITDRNFYDGTYQKI